MTTEAVLQDKIILVVDDEPDVLETVGEMLDMCLVYKAKSYDEAVEYLRGYTIDIAILDIMGVNGFDLLKRCVDKGVPAVMLTAHALTPEALKKSMKLGAVTFLPKEKISEIDNFLADVALGGEAREQARVRAARYFRLATIYACKPPEGITLLAGVSGSGKSYLARAMSSLWGLTWLRSDVVRKELHGLLGQKAAAPFGKGIYSRDKTHKTYQILAEQTAAEVASGMSVIVDAGSLKAADRKFIYEVAKSNGVPVRLVVCRAPWSVLVENLRKREAAGVDVSDADIEIARRQRFESPTQEELEMISWLEVDTQQDLLEQLYHLVTAQ